MVSGCAAAARRPFKQADWFFKDMAAFLEGLVARSIREELYEDPHMHQKVFHHELWCVSLVARAPCLPSICSVVDASVRSGRAAFQALMCKS